MISALPLAIFPESRETQERSEGNNRRKEFPCFTTQERTADFLEFLPQNPPRIKPITGSTEERFLQAPRSIQILQDTPNESLILK